jgi:hypothetical protein
VADKVAGKEASSGKCPNVNGLEGNRWGTFGEGREGIKKKNQTRQLPHRRATRGAIRTIPSGVTGSIRRSSFSRCRFMSCALPRWAGSRCQGSPWRGFRRRGQVADQPPGRQVIREPLTNHKGKRRRDRGEGERGRARDPSSLAVPELATEGPPPLPVETRKIAA